MVETGRGRPDCAGASQEPLSRLGSIDLETVRPDSSQVKMEDLWCSSTLHVPRMRDDISAFASAVDRHASAGSVCRQPSASQRPMDAGVPRTAERQAALVEWRGVAGVGNGGGGALDSEQPWEHAGVRDATRRSVSRGSRSVASI